MHRVVSVKVNILGSGACECTQGIARKRAENGAGLRCTRHRAGRHVSKPQDRPWLACLSIQGRHRRVQAWTGLEEQEEFATTLLQDSHDELMASVNTTHVVEDPSDDELNDVEDKTLRAPGRGRGGGESMPPPSYAELSSFFSPLDHFAQSCGNDEARNSTFLRKARIPFIRDFAFTPAQQADIKHQTSGNLSRPSAYTVQCYSSRIILYHTARQFRTVL